MVEAVVVSAEGGEEEDDMVVVAAVAVSAVVTPAPVAFVVMDDIMLLKLPLRRRGVVRYATKILTECFEVKTNILLVW